MKPIYLCLVAFFLQSAVSAQPAKKPQFEIKGQVIDVEGRPVAGVTVFAYPDALRGRLPTSYSDGLGKFTIVVHQTGPYLISAAKQGDGYPNTINPFYNPSGESLAQLLVEENRAPQFVTILLGPRAGKISGEVIDAETNRPVEELGVRLCRAASPKYCLRRLAKYPSGQFQFLVPSALFTIQISAVGYKDWNGADGVKQQSQPLRVASNDTKKIYISLQKTSARDDNIPSLPAPEILSPVNGTEFRHYPRVTKLDWSAVPGALSYTVEIDFCMPGGADGKECKDPQPLDSRINPPTSGIEGTSYQLLFIGAQPGRWRLWGVDREGRAGAKSAWHTFVYVYQQ
jgi:hypothetical protein